MSSRPPSRIGFFLPDLNFGGVEQVTFKLAAGLADRGFHVDLVAADATGSAADLVPASVRVVDLHTTRTASAIPGLVRYLRLERPRTVVAAKDHANVVAILATLATRPRVPVIVTAHSRPSDALRNPERWTGRIVKRILPYAYRHAHTVVAVSDGVADDIREMCGDSAVNLAVIRNPVIGAAIRDREGIGTPTLDWFRPPHDIPVVIWCGRMSAEKDPLTALEAFRKLSTRREARLLYVGDGPLRNDVAAYVQRLALEEHVAFTGYVSDPLPYVAHADVLLLSSQREGLPTALIEALALGTRVVSTDCQAGPREILHDGEYGSLVPVGDAEAMSRALEHALDNPQPHVPDEALSEYWVETATDHYVHLLDEVGAK